MKSCTPEYMTAAAGTMTISAHPSSPANNLTACRSYAKELVHFQEKNKKSAIENTAKTVGNVCKLSTLYYIPSLILI